MNDHLGTNSYLEEAFVINRRITTQTVICLPVFFFSMDLFSIWVSVRILGGRDQAAFATGTRISLRLDQASRGIFTCDKYEVTGIGY